MGKTTQPSPKAQKIRWADMLIYRIFRWRWNAILMSHPGMLKGLYDSLGQCLDAKYPGLKDKQIDWADVGLKASNRCTKDSKLKLVVDNTQKDCRQQD